MSQRNIILNLLVLGLGLAGCISNQPQVSNKPTRAEKIAQEAITKSFGIITRGVVEGDLKTVYQYLSTTQHEQQSYEEFVKDYELNKSVWRTIFCGAYLKQIAVEENKATVIIIWGNGEVAGGEFVKEMEAWRLNFLRGTTPGITPRPVEERSQ